MDVTLIVILTTLSYILGVAAGRHKENFKDE